MPFWYHIPIPSFSESKPQTIRLVEGLVKEGEEFRTGTRLAIVETPGGRFAVLANGNGFLRERLSRVGAEVDSGTPICTVNADGEDIPYGRPYSTAEWVDHTR
jgi:pyruvate/2-oxoglutarate dehydrogenase complex dihydrolipoamide acyltransferase (E2) component